MCRRKRRTSDFYSNGGVLSTQADLSVLVSFDGEYRRPAGPTDPSHRPERPMHPLRRIKRYQYRFVDSRTGVPCRSSGGRGSSSGGFHQGTPRRAQ